MIQVRFPADYDGSVLQSVQTAEDLTPSGNEADH
jgi:hypothetical protein